MCLRTCCHVWYVSRSAPGYLRRFSRFKEEQGEVAIHLSACEQMGLSAPKSKQRHHQPEREGIVSLLVVSALQVIITRSDSQKLGSYKKGDKITDLNQTTTRFCC